MIGHSVQLFNDFLKSGLLRFIPAHHQSLEVSSVSFDKCSPLCSPCHRLPCSSAGKESACKAGDPSSTPGLGRSPGEGKGYLLPYSWASPGGSDSKESACNARNPGSMPELGRSLGEGKDNPLQYPCLGNSKYRGAWRATVHRLTESWT